MERFDSAQSSQVHASTTGLEVLDCSSASCGSYGRYWRTVPCWASRFSNTRSGDPNLLMAASCWFSVLTKKETHNCTDQNGEEEHSKDYTTNKTGVVKYLCKDTVLEPIVPAVM